ncbi:MAG TPA: hypothetical protein PK230_08295 [Chitinophagales bacterium]|nr:hypothetical protein [Chitinophagales bacterium]
MWWSDYGARWLDLQRGVWGQIDPLTEKYVAWSGYNYVEDNPIRKLDPNGKEPMDNYYMNQQGDMLAVVRTTDSQDNFYVVDPQNQVSLVHTRQIDPTWSRVTDGEKNAIVDRIRHHDHYGEAYQVNAEGLNRKQQGKVQGMLTNAGNVAPQAGIATGSGNINGTPVLGAVHSTINPTPAIGNGIRAVLSTDQPNPGGAPANLVVPQNGLPTPTAGQKQPLSSGNLPANLSYPVTDDGQVIGNRILTDGNGLIPQK